MESRCVLRTVFFNEAIERLVRIVLPYFVQVTFRFGLHAFGHFVQDVGCIVDLAALLTSPKEHLSDRRPETKSTVAHRNLRR